MERALCLHNIGVQVARGLPFKVTPWVCSPLLRTLAALADAHDEAFLLTRLADSEEFDVNEFHGAILRLLGLITIGRQKTREQLVRVWS